MPLTPGTRLGVYEIVAPLGAGGMGAVYRARDTKLGRAVAIKVILEEFASSDERVGRFEREAKMLASLNHPRIASLFGMEHVDGQHFLVMELIEGETLADRLRRGRMDVEEALPIAVQIADALESAHEQGVVHRDLKPANVKVTPADQVKVLDFGLAKAMDSAPAASSPANSPTLSVLATQAGIIMGTAAYMSPEQAKGAATDRRSDVFSFGVVLYELLSGRQPFRGDTAAEIMASVMIREADLAAMPTGLNPRIAELIKRCLEKNPKKRWQAMGDLRVELESLAAAPHQIADPMSGTIVAPRPLSKRAIPVVAAVVVTAVVATLATRWLIQSPPPEVVRFAIASPNLNQAFRNLAMSPDGTRLVYVANVGPGRRQLMLRTMGDLEARPIAGTDGLVNNPSFSPDGQSIAFFSTEDESVKKVAVTGGAAVTLAKGSVPLSGLSWSGSWILFGQANGVQRVSANGGEPEVIIPIETGQRVAGPQLIDDRGSILFSFATEPGAEGWNTAQVIVRTPDGTRHVVVSGGSDARYLPSGHLVYAVGATLLAVPFDAATRRVLGGTIPVLEGVSRSSQQQWAAHFAVSAAGSLAYVPGAAVAAAQRTRTLALVDMSGMAQPLAVPVNAYAHPRVSPDGRRVAVATDDAKEAAIWIYELSGSGPPRRLTFEGRNLAPIWTRDGQFITFQSDREGDRGLFQQQADGTRAAERLTKAEPGSEHSPDSWSPDGKTLSFRVFSNGVASIWTWSREGDRNPRRLLHGARSYVASQFSPDGRWLAYGTNELDGGPFRVFLQPFPQTGAKYQVSPMAASTPVWSPDGKQLFFAYNDRIYGVGIRTAPAFMASQPVELKLPGIMASSGSMRHFDLMPDGKHFLVVLPEGAGNPARQTPPQINVVLNWFEELKAKAPAK